MTTDALGKEIQIGEKYSYSQHSNGHLAIVRGVAEKVERGRVTLGEVEERGGVYGKIDTKFKPQNRRRSVYAATLFPIVEEEEKLFQIPQIIGEFMRPCFMSEEKFEEGYRTSKFWTEANFMDAYRNHIVGMGHVAECAKIYILKNWKKIKDWNDLHLVVTHGPTNKETEYYNYTPSFTERSNESESSIINDIFSSLDEDNQKRHNPVTSFDDVVLDPTDGDFSVTINGNEHWWIKDEAVIVLANFIEEKLKM